MRTALYRLFGADDTLLYIGISGSFGTRWQKHANRSAWWPEVRHQTIDWYDSRDEAGEAEVDAIQAEQPKYNVVHNRPQPAAEPVSVIVPHPSAANELRDLFARFPPWHRDCTMQDELGFLCNETLIKGACPTHGLIEIEITV